MATDSRRTSGGWLDVHDVARMLRIPVVKVQRWVHQGKIPCRFSNRGYRFRRTEIQEWARLHDMPLAPLDGGGSAAGSTRDLLERAVAEGGIFFDLQGQDIYSVLHAACQRLPLESEEEREKLLEELLAREELASTGVGRGVAIPHPRRPNVGAVPRPRIYLFFLKSPVDFSAVDGLPVDLLFLMISPDNRAHLGLLSRLGYLLRSKDFPGRLRECRSPETAMAVIREAEQAISADGGGPA